MAGVSSTTVASRLSTAVVTDAAANTRTNRRPGSPRDPRASSDANHANTPCTSARCARTRIAAKNPTVGPSSRICAKASVGDTTPASTTRPAAGIATTASDHPRGATIANTSTAASSSGASTGQDTNR